MGADHEAGGIGFKGAVAVKVLGLGDGESEKYVDLRGSTVVEVIQWCGVDLIDIYR